MQTDIIIEYSARGMAHLVTVIPIRDEYGIASTDDPVYEAAGTLMQAFDVASEIVSQHLAGGEVDAKTVSGEIRWRRITDNYWTGTVSLWGAGEVDDAS